MNFERQILDWFNIYQWQYDKEKMLELYKNLVLEEYAEFEQANTKADFIDAVCDLAWVYTIYRELAKGTSKYDDEIFSVIWDYNWEFEKGAKKYFWLDLDTEKWDKVFNFIISVAMLEVIRSNYTKKLEYREDWKVKKWENFVAPRWEMIFELLEHIK